VAEQSLKVGEFEVAAAVPGGAAAPGPRQVEMEFSDAQQLPGGDGRAVGARLSFAGFTPAPQPPARLERFPDDLRKPQVESQGVSDDGWLAQSASFQLTQPPGAESLRVSGMVPKVGDGDGFTTEVVLTVDGQEVARKTVGLDRFTIDATLPVPTAVPAEAAGPARRVGLSFSRVQSLPAPDGRAVGAKLLSAGYDTPAY